MCKIGSLGLVWFFPHTILIVCIQVTKGINDQRVKRSIELPFIVENIGTVVMAEHEIQRWTDLLLHVYHLDRFLNC